MNVFVLFASIDYEGDKLVGVFSSIDKAEKVRKEIIEYDENDPGYDDESAWQAWAKNKYYLLRGDSYFIESVIIDKIIQRGSYEPTN